MLERHYIPPKELLPSWELKNLSPFPEVRGNNDYSGILFSRRDICETLNGCKEKKLPLKC